MATRLFCVMIFMAVLFALSGCGTSERSITLASLEKSDPSDELLFSTIQNFILLTGAPQNAQYKYARTDINGDGLRDALVLFDIPHRHWCGRGGCTLVIFSANREGFSLLSKTINIRGPVILSPKMTLGFHDIIVRLSGMDYNDQTIRLVFDGKSYPPNAAQRPPIPYAFEDIVGPRILP